MARVPAAPVAHRLVAAAATSAGRRRPRNEDAHRSGPAVCVVADGMAGLAHGAVAARLAVDVVSAELTAPPATHDRIVAACRCADAAIRARAVDLGGSAMGTTVVGVTIAAIGGAVVPAVFHVGDSRCYRLRQGVLELVTRDHGAVQALVTAGHLRPERSAGHPLAGVVTDALGLGEPIRVDVAPLGAGPCRLLLCTDGLSDQLPPRVLGRVLAGVPDPALAAACLVDLTLRGPARDNVTAMVVDVVALADASLDTVAGIDHDGAAPTSGMTRSTSR